MAGTVNRVILVGRLGKDPELKYTPSGAPVAKFSLATDESFKDKTGEKQERTEWHNIVAWNKLAEICGEYLTKGKLVFIEGSIRSRQWQDQSGNKRTSYDIIANQMQMLGSKAIGTSSECGCPPERIDRPCASETGFPPNPRLATKYSVYIPRPRPFPGGSYVRTPLPPSRMKLATIQIFPSGTGSRLLRRRRGGARAAYGAHPSAERAHRTFSLAQD